MQAMRQAVPGAGSTLSDCDFALQDWRQACCGASAARPPEGLFFVHHGIGSEAWSPDGFDRTG